MKNQTVKKSRRTPKITRFFITCLHTGSNAKYSVTVHRGKNRERSYSIKTIGAAINALSSLMNLGGHDVYTDLAVYPTIGININREK